MKITNLDSLEKIAVTMDGAKDVFKQTPISGADGAPVFSFRVFTIMPGGNTPYHTHPFEHVNYIIDGAGVLVTETGEERLIQKGDFALVLPNEKHSYKNTGAEKPLLVICAVTKEYE